MTRLSFIPGSRNPLGGRAIGPFRIRDKHTVYEWVMIYTDRHPQPRQTDGTDSESMRVREVFMGARSTNAGRFDPKQKALRQKANAVYREILRSIDTGAINPVQLAFCSDQPRRPDTTRHIVAVGPILELALRRKDGGSYIAELSISHSDGCTSAGGSRAETHSSITLESASIDAIREAMRQVYDDAERAGGKPPNVKEAISATVAVLRSSYHVVRKDVERVADELEFERRRVPSGEHFTKRHKRT